VLSSEQLDFLLGAGNRSQNGSPVPVRPCRCASLVLPEKPSVVDTRSTMIATSNVRPAAATTTFDRSLP
jgi:hypothetical protein